MAYPAFPLDDAPAPGTPGEDLTYGGPPDMVPFLAGSRWGRRSLLLAAGAALLLMVLTGLSVVKRHVATDAPASVAAQFPSASSGGSER